MNNFPDDQEIQQLINYNQSNCVSIYMPIIETASISDPNRIELKNLLTQAKIGLLDMGVPKRDTKKTLQPGEELLIEYEYWPRQSKSIAIYMHKNFFIYYLLPDQKIPRMITIGKGFNLKPLQKAMMKNRSYFVLALGHKDVRLYEGDHYNLWPVELKNFPTNMSESLRIDEQPKWREKHSIAPASFGRRSEAVHGQYNVSQVDKLELEEFFRKIDNRLHFFLTSQHKPLILAGVKYLLPIYRKINTYSYLWPESINGSIKARKRQDIQKEAWSLVSTTH